jgi:tetratricopeptide (TPR) repeat protein
LDQFLDVDDGARDRVATISSVIGLAAFAFGRIALGLQGKTLGYITFGVVVCAYCGLLLQYCETSTRKPIRTERFAMPRRFILGAATLGIMVLLILFPPAAAEAAMIDRKLRKSTEKIPLSPEDAREVAVNFEIARANRIPLPSQTKVRVNQALKASALEKPSEPWLITASRQCVEYRRAITPSLNLNQPNGGQKSAVDILREPVSLGLSVLPFLEQPTPDSMQRAQRAILGLSRVIPLVAAEPIPFYEALELRAIMFIHVGDFSGALADVASLESMGDLDLSNVVSIEAVARYLRGLRDGREDLLRALELFKLANDLPQPTWDSDPKAVATSQLSNIGNQANIYFLLGMPTMALEAAKQVVSRAPTTSDPKDFAQKGYPLVVASYVAIGATEDALRTVDEWHRAIPDDPRAAIVYADLTSPDFDRERFLRQFTTVR